MDKKNILETVVEVVASNIGLDNIDHNPSSTTAPDSFHGTSISMVQCISDSDKKPELLLIDSTVQGKRSVQTLPNSYTLVAPLE